MAGPVGLIQRQVRAGDRRTCFVANSLVACRRLDNTLERRSFVTSGGGDKPQVVQRRGLAERHSKGPTLLQHNAVVHLGGSQIGRIEGDLPKKLAGTEGPGCITKLPACLRASCNSC